MTRMHSHFVTAVVVISVLLVGLTAGSVVGEVTLETDPYESLDWEAIGQYRANLHTHTTESDGRLEPAEVIDEYHSRGYDVLAVTDHNVCTWPWDGYGRSAEKLGMVAIPGNELSRHHHTLSLFSTF